MKGAVQRGMVAGVIGISLAMAAGVTSAADVTDADRTFRNFTREAATVNQGDVRLEVRGLEEEDDGDTRLNLLGYPVHLGSPANKRHLTGGVVDLLGSWGLAKNAELGFDIPGYIQSLKFANGTRKNAQDVGDILMYLKIKRAVAEHCSVGAGMELTLPNGPVQKGLGTGEMSFNPNVSTRYQRGRLAIGANVGYQMYTGDTRTQTAINDFQAVDVFNYGTEVIVRGSALYALRVELAGRVFNQHGTRYHDLTVLPGVDFNVANNLIIRPQGMAGGTGTALDWGIGLGIAMKFALPAPALAQAPPPAVSPPPPAPPPPAKEKIILRGVHFDFNKATIREDARPILDQAVETLKEHGAIAILVEGHTDAIGGEEYNQQLSVRRAEAVRDYLSGHGIDSSRLSIAGHGKSEPVATNDTAEGRAQNRRVELRVTE
ncbi:MAG TPA: OmpA family protein [Candidatus Acidoferrales bacterium]|nr:OmpA family protein [Candidatus Acidoferrales bacterium]